jgi:hypothetical protein
MVRFYDTYSKKSFAQLVNHYGMQNHLLGTISNESSSDNESSLPVRLASLPKNDFVSIELTQIEKDELVPFEMIHIPNVLFSTGWSNHQLIMRQCKTNEQRLFYILYAGHEQLEYKELQRALKTDAMSAILGSKKMQSEMMKRKYPQSGIVFKDTVYLEMFGLPMKYKESKLRKKITAHEGFHFGDGQRFSVYRRRTSFVSGRKNIQGGFVVLPQAVTMYDCHRVEDDRVPSQGSGAVGVLLRGS